MQPPREEAEKIKAVPPTKTTPAQEWGEGIETGKNIARGGKETGGVAGTDNSTSANEGSDRPPRESHSPDE